MNKKVLTLSAVMAACYSVPLHALLILALV